MPAPAANGAPQGQNSRSRTPPETKTELTREQIQVIVERVYAMLIRDLKQEQERDRTKLRYSGTFKRGR